MPTKQQEVLTTYVGDIHALESHIFQALDKQVALLASHADAKQQVLVFRDILAGHLTALQSRLEALGGSPNHPLKEGVAAALGVAAGLVDKLRTEEAAKDLRDDYTALSHSIIAYEMLLTTALASGDQETAGLARKHMLDNARFVTRISRFMPKLVLDELREDGMTIADSVFADAGAQVAAVWKDSSDLG